jgi:hypothetical protein
MMLRGVVLSPLAGQCGEDLCLLREQNRPSQSVGAAKALSETRYDSGTHRSLMCQPWQPGGKDDGRSRRGRQVG